MSPCHFIELPLVDSGGRESGPVLCLSLPKGYEPKKAPLPLLDLRAEYHDDSTEPVQLLEGEEYFFKVEYLTEWQDLSFEPSELFVLDPDAPRGRLRCGLRTGTVQVEIRSGEVLLGSVAFEVRSRKLDYQSEYRRMLSDIADQFSEVLMERFAAASMTFEVDTSRPTATLYQQFAFLKSIVTSEFLEAAIGLVLRRPHISWVVTNERVPPGRGTRGNSQLAAQLAASGRRVPWVTRPSGSRIGHLPALLNSPRTEASFDNVPNRFVKFVLERWRYVLRSIEEALEGRNPSAAVQRGQREVVALTAFLDALLAEPLFREVGALSHFPADNQVLQKRAGYRDLARAYVQFELAARLTWEGGDDVYAAGQKDVATLYEYWVFLQLGEIIQKLAGQPFDFSKLLEVQADGLGIRLKRRKQVVLSGMVERNGRKLLLEYCYNRHFPRGEIGSNSSWSRPMRPDCSLKIEPACEERATFPPIWIHFDAKYKVEHITDLFGGDEDEDEEGGGRKTKRDDLLKMHAYRDAIRRSAGAYVLYPGDKNEQLSEYHELLPGLGAFPLRPEPGGGVYGANALAMFIDNVLDHVASQLTQHERFRWWNREVMSTGPGTLNGGPKLDFLRAPAADSGVLLGYVKGAEHERWIRENRLYNVRADGRPGSMEVESLGVEWLVLYGPSLQYAIVVRVSGPVLVQTKKHLIASGYPNPRGDAYMCLPWDDVPEADRLLSAENVLRVVQREAGQSGLPGAPVTSTWHDLLHSIEG